MEWFALATLDGVCRDAIVERFICTFAVEFIASGGLLHPRRLRFQSEVSKAYSLYSLSGGCFVDDKALPSSLTSVSYLLRGSTADDSSARRAGL